MNFLAQSQLSNMGDGNALVSFFMHNPFLFAFILAWALVWKGLALWKSARLSHKWWFVIILVANTFGILEIIYLYFVARKYSVEVESEEKIEKVSEQK